MHPEVGGGDDFAALAEGHRRELHLHCYRMLASYEEAEDAVQETLIRAWRGRERFDGAALRAWLYRIATNVCVDASRRRARRPIDLASMAEVPWLQPYPDLVLDQGGGDGPESAAVERETIELLFLAALHCCPPVSAPHSSPATCSAGPRTRRRRSSAPALPPPTAPCSGLG